ncbi:MAG TPA: hypothetical protein VN726_22050 [Hanamia sp.]|jgi:hypothetical protein|nr:hypothetical protein [Hanamia sp.]
MKILLLLISTLFFLSPSFSQNAKKDSLSDVQIKNATELYAKFTGPEKPVYNGTQYLYYTFKMDGDPYFITGNFSTGWVEYKGRKYDSLSVMYDVNRNKVVIYGQDRSSMIVLENDFIDSFNLLGHTFIKLYEDHKDNLYYTGFYDMLYNGHIQFLARRIKTRDPQIKGDLLVNFFYIKDRYYIHRDGLYYLVSNKKDVYHLFKDNLHNLKKMMRKDHLKFRKKNFEATMIKVTAFYDQLTH